MKKISEMNMAELTACICKLSGPAEKLFSDGAVIDALDDFRNRIPENATIETAFSLFMAAVLPVITSDEHKMHTYAILSALCDQPVEGIEARNGLEVMRDLFLVFAMERDVETIFRPGCQGRG